MPALPAASHPYCHVFPPHFQLFLAVLNNCPMPGAEQTWFRGAQLQGHQPV